MKKIAQILLFLALSATAYAENANWYWHKKNAPDHSSSYFRMAFHLPEKPVSAAIAFAVDDIGVIYVNGKRLAQRQSLKTTVRNLAGELRAGENVIAIAAENVTGEAGVILRGFVTFPDGSTQVICGNDRFKSNDRLFPDWYELSFDDSAWSGAVLIGPCDSEPWKKRVPLTPFLDLPPVVIPSPEKAGRVMAEDFTTISTWRGGPDAGARPGAVHPFDFNFGSIPDSRRDDGWAGGLRFDFSEPGGIVEFSKNSVFHTDVIPLEIEFSADAEGQDGEIYFEFSDRFGTRAESAPVRIGGNGWRDYRLKIDASTVPDFDMMRLPLSLRKLLFKKDAPGKGEIRIDDIAFLADVSPPSYQIGILPVYATLGFEPGKPVALRFQFRNGLSREVALRLKLKVMDDRGQVLLERDGEAKVGASSLATHLFQLGVWAKKGGYHLELTADNGSVSRTFSGWLGIFTPNDCRPNHHPMWFGIEDQEIQTAPYENLLHVQWMKQLGVDLIRAGIIGIKFEPLPGDLSGYDAVRRLWQPYVDAKMLILCEYSELVPRWTLTEAGQKKWSVLELNRPRFEEHMTRLAKFLDSIPQVRYFEWFNEPDLHGYSGSVEDYMESMKLLYPIIKANAPRVEVATGGILVGAHPRAKKDFLSKLYLDSKEYYDIAAFHGHDDYRTYKNYIPRIKEMFARNGFTRKFGNTEAGFRSHYDSPELFFIQAQTLVQKIAFSKYAGAEFYIWFMLQDYGDKFLNSDDSFGLVTAENQPKPSFLAYNELIRQLADTVPDKEVELDPRLETLPFRTAENRRIWVCWPRGDATEFSFALGSRSEVTVSDMYGNEEHLSPGGGVVFLHSQRYPFYISGAEDLHPLGTPVSMAGSPVLVSGESSSLTLELKNPYEETVDYVLKTGLESGRGTLAPHGKAAFAIPVKVAGNDSGTVAITGTLELKRPDGSVLYRGAVNASCPIALAVSSKPCVIPMRDGGRVRELAFDTLTPKWQGPGDLGADVSVSCNDRALLFDANVTDDDHSIPGHGVNIWRNDCVQVGVATSAGEHFEFTVSGRAGEPEVWCHISPGGRRNGQWRIPASIERRGDQTRYQFEVPFQQLNLSGKSGELFRMALVVNDNDHGRHLRYMEWNGGIQPRKNPDLFGWMKLVR